MVESHVQLVGSLGSGVIVCAVVTCETRSSANADGTVLAHRELI